MITEWDEEYYGKSIGSTIPEEQVKDWFERDVQRSINDCISLFDNFDDLPEEAQHIIANMMFNMGRPRLSKFKGMKRGVDARDWNAAADEMVDSRWYQQVTKRADRLVTRMRALA